MLSWLLQLFYKTVVCVLNGLIFFIIIIVVGQYVVYIQIK